MSRSVLPLPVEWRREGSAVEYEAHLEIACPIPRFPEHRYWFLAKVAFYDDLACWQAFVSLNGCIIYASEHREREEACGAAVVAMQRALDVRHPS